VNHSPERPPKNKEMDLTPLGSAREMPGSQEVEYGDKDMELEE